MTEQDYTIEVIKSHGLEVLFDEVYPMRQCPECGYDVARGWLYCPSCGADLPYGELPLVSTCENISPDPSFFQCSACGRTYVPVQVLKKDAESKADWSCCPGCMAVLT